MADYDIAAAFQSIEDDMIASMSRNLKHHLDLEEAEEIEYVQWQAEQLKMLQQFRQDNPKYFKGQFRDINYKIDELIQTASETGRMDQEIEILQALKRGWNPSRTPDANLQGEFFRSNQKKLQALIDATTNDMKKAETAMLRTANDRYRKTIFNAGVAYNAGSITLSKAVDIAAKDYLAAGMNCIEYVNGTRVPIDSYAKMALRTAETRAYLSGEASKRDEWGINTVIVNQRGAACPMCMKFVGYVYYDDVWGSIKSKDNKYPLLSSAISGGLYHPNCKDTHTAYFEGISDSPETPTQKEQDEADRIYKLEQQQRYNERQVRKYTRLSSGSLDTENVSAYKEKLKYWEKRNSDFVKANSGVLKRQYDSENVYNNVDFNNKTMQSAISSMKLEKVRINNMRSVLGKEMIPDSVDIIEKMPYTDEQMRYVNLDYERRKRLIDNPDLALPNAETATIADEKFIRYLFNPENTEGYAKGKAIESRLGYNINNWEELKASIYNNQEKYPVTNNGQDKHGVRWEQKQILYGLKGKPANTIVAWVSNGSKTHLTSIYIKEV